MWSKRALSLRESEETPLARRAPATVNWASTARVHKPTVGRGLHRTRTAGHTRGASRPPASHRLPGRLCRAADKTSGLPRRCATHRCPRFVQELVRTPIFVEKTSRPEGTWCVEPKSARGARRPGKSAWSRQWRILGKQQVRIFVLCSSSVVQPGQPRKRLAKREYTS